MKNKMLSLWKTAFASTQGYSLIQETGLQAQVAWRLLHCFPSVAVETTKRPSGVKQGVKHSHCSEDLLGTVLSTHSHTHIATRTSRYTLIHVYKYIFFLIESICILSHSKKDLKCLMTKIRIT